MAESRFTDRPPLAEGADLALQRGRGRRVLWAIFVFVLIIPAINIKQMVDHQVPAFLLNGGINIAFAIGMFSSVLLVLLWYFAYQGKRFARVILGACYLAAAAVVMVILAGVSMFQSVTLVHLGFGLVLGTLYGLVGWVLLMSDNIKAFQVHQRAARRHRLAKLG